MDMQIKETIMLSYCLLGSVLNYAMPTLFLILLLIFEMCGSSDTSEEVEG